MLLRTCLKSFNSCCNRNTIGIFQPKKNPPSNTIIQSVRLICTSKLNGSNNTKRHVPVERVYYGVLTPQIKAVKVFSLSSSIVGLIAQPFLYNEIASTGNISIIVAVYSCIGFFTFVTPLLLHLVTKKYVIHLDYIGDKDAYVASTINFFCMSRETEFKVEDVKVPDVPGMFTTLTAKGKALFFDPKFFKHPDHYARLMGYDKPIDFKLHETNVGVSESMRNEDKTSL